MLMNSSLFLAKVLGPYLIIISVGGFINQKMLGKAVKMYAKEVPILFFSGAFALLAGLLLVISHNVWTRDWRVIITVLGWAALIKGVLRLLMPASVGKMLVKAYNALSPVAFILALVAGIYLAKVGFAW